MFDSEIAAGDGARFAGAGALEPAGHEPRDFGVAVLGPVSAEEAALIDAINAELAADRGPAADADWWEDLPEWFVAADGSSGVPTAGPDGGLDIDEEPGRPCPDGEWLASQVPSAFLGGLLEGVDPTSARDAYGAVELVAAWSRVVSWAQAGMARAAAALQKRMSVHDEHRPAPRGRVAGQRLGRLPGTAAAEIAVRLALSRPAAQAVIENGIAFGDALFPVGDALASGEIDLPRARAFVEALGELPAQTAVDVQDAVLPTAPGRSAAQVRRDIAAALISVHPAEAAERHSRARDRRRVTHPGALSDGMGSMYVVMPAVDLVALDLALDAAARSAQAGGDGRTIDQLRADALASVGHNALAVGWIGAVPPGACGACHCGSARGCVSDESVGRGSEGATRAGCSGDDPPGDPGYGASAGMADAAGGDRSRAVDGDVSGGGVAGGCGAASDGDGGHDGASTAGASPPGPLTAHGVGGPEVADRGVVGAGAAPDEGAPLRAFPRVGFRVGSLGGRPARIQVLVPLGTLVGTDEDGATVAARLRWEDPGGGDPQVHQAPVAILEGYGPITPDVARAIAMGGTWQRLVTDPAHGTVLDVGRERYAPPPDMADVVRARDRYCVRPGCGAAARGCDLDHTVPYHLGGRTAVDNLGALCSTDHALKSAGIYRVEQPRSGVFDFHLPSGHSYRRHLDGTTTPLPRRDREAGSPAGDAPEVGPAAGALKDGDRDGDRPPF